MKNDEKPAIPNDAEMTQEEMIDDEDFVDSSEDEIDEDVDEQKDTKELVKRNQFPIDEMEHKELPPSGTSAVKKLFFSKSTLVKGLSLGNLKAAFRSPSKSPKMKKSKSSSILNDIEKDDEKRKLLMKNATESFESSGESDLYFSMDHTKESWHVDDVSNINYFLNQTGMQEQHQGVRNSMSPITKSTQRMPKAMQESIMTPRSRKPVMITMFGNNSNPKSYQANISQLLEESEEVPNDSSESPSTGGSKESSGSNIPLIMNNDDIAAANDNGLPTVNEDGSGLTSAFK